ncbi:MAG: glycosyltransferase [Candidatus Binataceae bacterium]|nr:glycosyltransferase [Candidatus Binataceae bacterium]
MRILHIASGLDSRDGGAATACTALCRELARQGHDVTIYTTFLRGRRDNWRHYAGDLRRLTVRAFPVLPNTYDISLALYRALAESVRTTDVVHIHGIYRFNFIAGVRWSRHYQVPYVVKPHGSLDPFLYRVRRWRKWPLEKLVVASALAHAGAVQFTAEEEMLLAASTGLFRADNQKPVFNAVVVPEGVDLNDSSPQPVGPDFAQLFPQAAGKRVILFLGRINFKKGLDILAKAYGIVRRVLPDTHLVIAGPDNEGYEATLRRCLAIEGVAPHVTFTGMLTGAAKIAAFKAASVFVLPSYTENFGLVLCEAMQHSLPVVVSNKVNIWREIAAADAGIVVECAPSQVAAAILKLLEKPELAQAMGERGASLVREQYRIESVAQDMLEVYQRLIADYSCNNLQAKGMMMQDRGI